MSIQSDITSDVSLPLVSIIVPVYNSSKYLNECLDSILNQTYHNLEVICVNDGSVDNSLDILKDYEVKDNRVHVISKENEGTGGAAPARNMGYKYATGKYVQWLDSDDFFELDMIKTLVEKAESTNADIVICGAKCFDDRTKQMGLPYATIIRGLALTPSQQPFSYRDCKNHIFQIGNTYIWNKLFKRVFYENSGLKYDSIPITDDVYVANLSVILAERITTVNENFICYRINTGVSQCDNRTSHPDSAYVAFWPVIKKLNNLDIYDEIRQSHINLIMICIRYFYDGIAKFDVFEYLHNTLRDEVFPRLNILDLSEDYFYDPLIYRWFRMIVEKTASQVAFDSAFAWSRKYGKVAATTLVLRE